MSILKFLKKIFLPEVDEFIPSTENEKKKTKVEFKELKEAWEAFKSEEFDKARDISENYMNDNNAELKFEAEKIIALTYFRQGNYEKSTLEFNKLSLRSKNPDDWFNLVTSLTLDSKFLESEKAFKKAIELYADFGNHGNISIPNMRFYYMQALKDMKQYERAYSQLEALSEFYTKLTITDSTFLYMRGVPFLEHTVDSSKEILENINPSKSKKWISSLKNGIDEYGKEYLTEFENKLNYAS